jgi:hypothetical protein
LYNILEQDDNKYPVKCFKMLLYFYNPEDTRVMKFFPEKGVRIKVQKECDAVRPGALLGTENHKLAVILDWQCEGSSRLLAEVRKSYIRKPFLGQLRAHVRRKWVNTKLRTLCLTVATSKNVPNCRQGGT